MIGRVQHHCMAPRSLSSNSNMGYKPQKCHIFVSITEKFFRTMLSCFREKIREVQNKTSTREEAYYVKERGDSMVFNGSRKNFLHNGSFLLAERISLFDGKTNPVRCLSVDDLNAMQVSTEIQHIDSYARWCEAFWEGRRVLVKLIRGDGMYKNGSFGDIVIATEMATHLNVLKLLGCCLETKYPVLVFECTENGSLQERILGDGTGSHNKAPLYWNDRLKISWEIAHTMSYLHTAFRRPIIHRNLKTGNVLLDGDNSAKLLDFHLAVCVPQGKEYVYADIMGTMPYIAPEYIRDMRVSCSSDVFSFGILFLVLLTGERAPVMALPEIRIRLLEKSVFEIVDPAITTASMIAADEHLQQQLRRSLELALKCTADEISRPTMVDVATELKSIITCTPVEGNVQQDQQSLGSTV